MNNMNKKYRKKGSMFLELMIAMFVLMVGIAGSIGLIHKTIAASSANSNQLTATYLAQEAIEVIRNIRDSNFINEKDYVDGIYSSIDDHCSFCFVEYDSTSIDGIENTSEDNIIYYKNDFFSHDTGGEETIFKRSIATRNIDIDTYPTNRIKVVVTVSWSEKGEDYETIIPTHLYNWKNND
jgi:hypothetical protein